MKNTIRLDSVTQADNQGSRAKSSLGLSKRDLRINTNLCDTRPSFH